jgi:hypothetical protein
MNVPIRARQPQLYLCVMPSSGCPLIAFIHTQDRHCPKCQGAAARTWLAEREADVLPVGYFHVVFSVPAKVADIAGRKGGRVRPAIPDGVKDHAPIAADRRHLGASIGVTAPCSIPGAPRRHTIQIST